MATESHIRGNLLANPVLKTVKVKGQEARICEFRMMSDVWHSDEQGQRLQDPERTHPVQVTAWDEALAQSCAHVLRTGMRVHVVGASYPHVYRVSDADRAAGKQDLLEMRCNASQVSLALNRVDSVQMRMAGRAADGAADDGREQPAELASQ